jgi:branched-chain amino acid aminotransferase
VQPTDEYAFFDYGDCCWRLLQGAGLSPPVDGLMTQHFDHAASQGVGSVKAAGIYAADLLPNMLSKKKGYPIDLYLDARAQTMIEEFSTSNFVGINNSQKKYMAPKPPLSTLPSITNKSLMQIAKDLKTFD